MVIKVRFGDFRTITRSRTLDHATHRGTDVMDAAWSMLVRLPVERGVRLVGVGVANLGKDAPEQQTLFDAEATQGRGTRRTRRSTPSGPASATRSIKPARLVGSDRRPGDQQWGPSDPNLAHPNLADPNLADPNLSGGDGRAGPG